MQDWDFFENVFGVALTATLIPHLTHVTLCKLTNFDPDNQQDNLVPINNRPKQPNNNSSTSTTVFNQPPSLKLPPHKKQQDTPRSGGVSKDIGKFRASTEKEEKEDSEGESYSGGGGYYESGGEYSEIEGYIEAEQETINESELAIGESELAELAEQANLEAIQWLEQQGINIQEAMQLAKVGSVQEFAKLPVKEISRAVDGVMARQNQQEQESQTQQGKQLKERLEKAFGGEKNIGEIGLEMAGLALEGFLRTSIFVTDETIQTTIDTADQFLDALFKSGNLVSFKHFHEASKGNLKEALRNYQNYTRNHRTIEKIESKYHITKEQLVKLSKKPLRELYLNEHSKTLKDINKITERQNTGRKLQENQKIKEEKLAEKYKEFQEKVRILRKEILLDQNQHDLRIESLIKQLKLVNPLLNEKHADIEASLRNAWNKYHNHYEGLTKKIDRLMKLASSENSDIQSNSKAFSQINQLINQRSNIITSMEREIPLVIERSKNQIIERNVEEQQTKLNREGHKLDKAAREQEYEKVREKILQFEATVEHVEHKEKEHTQKLDQIMQEFDILNPVLQTLGYSDLEESLQSEWDRYSKVYLEIRDKIDELSLELSNIAKNNQITQPSDTIIGEIKKLLEQQSSILDSMKQEIPELVEKYIDIYPELVEKYIDIYIDIVQERTQKITKNGWSEAFTIKGGREGSDFLKIVLEGGKKGIYVIRNDSDEENLYVGKSERGNSSIRARLSAHLTGSGNKRIGILAKDGKSFTIRWMPSSTPSLSEAVAIKLLQPSSNVAPVYKPMEIAKFDELLKEARRLNLSAFEKRDFVKLIDNARCSGYPTARDGTGEMILIAEILKRDSEKGIS